MTQFEKVLRLRVFLHFYMLMQMNKYFYELELCNNSSICRHDSTVSDAFHGKIRVYSI